MWAYVGLCSSLIGLFPAVAPAQPILASCWHVADPVHCTRESLRDAFQVALADVPVEGTLVFGLTIDSSGQLKTVDLLRDIDPPLGQRALDIMAQFTEWSVAIPEGQLEEVRWTLPVSLAPVDRGSGFQVSWGMEHGEAISLASLDQLVLLPILVMDPSGHLQPPAEVEVRYQKGERIRSWRSPSRLSAKAAKGLKRCRVHGLLTVVAYVQKGTRFEEVSRTWVIRP
ncbi:MAG: hypothetical protein H6568_08775 [Lewinellaceae bacterium]|nr:hypothetical protein [Lewinellaceae bacterium]